MKTITFYSYKGGTGRSLALANAARYLARLDFKVVAIDFDLEAPGLHYKFSSSSESTSIKVENGVVDYLYQFMSEGSVPANLQDFISNVEVPGAEKPPIHLMPAGKVPSLGYWSKLSRINWHELFYSENSQGVQLFLDLKSRIEEELKPDFLLIDSRTGITEMGGIATTILADIVVCLVLPVPENMEGARSVLRSLKKSRQAYEIDPLDILVAVSRLPEMKNSEDEVKHVNSVISVLNEVAENLEDTLDITNAYTLHSEAALQVKENLRVGGEISSDQSVLLRDYLRLFASFVPKEIIGPRINSLVEQAKQKIWFDASSALKEVEELAESFGHPETYKALLRFYEVRNVTDPIVIKQAERLWDITRNPSEPLLWISILRVIGGRSQSYSRIWEQNLDFIYEVWSNAGSKEPDFGMKLSEAYYISSNIDKSADILLEVIEMGNQSSSVISSCIERLSTAGRYGEVEKIVHTYKDILYGEVDFVESWARYSLASGKYSNIDEIIGNDMFPMIQRKSPVIATRLLLQANKPEEAYEAAEIALQSAAGAQSRKDIEQVAVLFKDMGRWDEFESKMSSIIPRSLIEELREDVNPSIRRRRAAPRIFTPGKSA